MNLLESYIVKVHSEKIADKENWMNSQYILVDVEVAE